MKPIRMETLSFKPLPPEFVGTACSKCNKLTSRWCVPVPSRDVLTVCSLCVMYEYPWGIQHKQDLEEFVSEVEKARGKPIERDSSGRVALVRDADGIIGAIVMVSRLDYVRNKAEVF